MSGLNKIKKSVAKFELNNIYANMTPQQIQNAIQVALDTQRKELIEEFKKKITELEKKYNNSIDYTASSIKELILVEFLYEFANQLDFWNMPSKTKKQQHTKESMRYRVTETYMNTMKSIEAYTDIKSSKKAHKMFQEKKKIITEEFDIDWV